MSAGTRTCAPTNEIDPLTPELIGTCALIVFARIVDVSLGTLRTVIIVHGRKGIAFLFGFFEVLIWITVVSGVIQNTERPVYAITSMTHEEVTSTAGQANPRKAKIAILSRNRHLYSTRRLSEAAKARGHEVRIVDYLKCHMEITSHRPSIFLGNEELTGYDAVIPRIAASHTSFGTAVVRQFEMMGVYCVNESVAISRTRDKLRSLQLLARKGVGLPVTTFAHDPKAANSLIKLCGGAPVVVKLLEGTQGIGVVLAETPKAAESIIEAFCGLNANLLVQEFIREASGAAIHCFVVGQKVVASMKRQSKEGDFRSNLHRGGSADVIQITPEERRTAVRAAGILGLEMAGVDLLRSNNGPVVVEVACSPGLEGLETATGKDVAGTIIELIAKNVRAESTRPRRTR